MESLNHLNSVNDFNEAKQVIPGGVNSPVRAFKSVGGTPPFIANGDRKSTRLNSSHAT